MQLPFFDADLPKYFNYGSIGHVVGHEITHAFDDVGRRFDKNGRIRDWWDLETKTQFLSKTSCMVDQYSRYTEKAVGLQVSLL